jgi:hypothetical protein
VSQNTRPDGNGENRGAEALIGDFQQCIERANRHNRNECEDGDHDE